MNKREVAINTSNLWLCLYFYQLSVDVFCRHQAQGPQAGKPVVILDRHRVFAMNEEAQAMNIMPGSSMGTVWSVSEQIISYERSESRELAALDRLAQWAYRFSPSVSLQPPNCLLLEVSGCLKLFKGLDALKQQIHEGLDELGFHVTTGINLTPLAALYGAKTALPDNLEPARLKSSIARLPVNCLEVDKKTITSLQQMGIAQMEQLLALPTDGLSRRFGVFFADHLARLTGSRPDPRKFISSKPRFSSELTFLTDVTNLESLVFPLRRLLAELEDYLRIRQLLVSQFRITLSHRGHGSRELLVYLADHDNDARMFLALAQLRLESITDLPEVDAICVSANTFVEVSESSDASDRGNGDLFTGLQQAGGVSSQADSARQTRLLNMLTARLGRESCFGLALADDHRPEKAWTTTSSSTAPSTRNGAGGRSKNQQPIEHDINPRPAYLLAKARRLEADDQQPRLSGPLALLQGPERIDVGWWDTGEDSARDYYIARHRQGALYWVYQNIHTREWYLHGIFS